MDMNMDMDMDADTDSPMGNVSVNGAPTLFTMQQIYWAVVGAAIGAFAIVNVYSRFLYWQRTRSISLTPAKPSSALFVAIATITAILRELGSASLPMLTIKTWRLPSPTLGQTALVLANALTLIALCVYRFHLNDSSSYEDIAYRTGFVSICQMPLLFLLAGKRNIIGYLTGYSYERINWLHRWASRCLLLTATIHMGYCLAYWGLSDSIEEKIRTDSMTKTGIIAWAIMVWIVFSSMAPIRGWSYEFFVIQHVISFTAFTVLIYIHVDDEVRYWIWICVGIFFFDRLVRMCYYFYNNFSLLHPSQRKDGTMGSLWALKAEFTAVSNNTTKVTIRNPPISWSPGQHVFLSCQTLAPMQAHPFTISSLPSDGKMEFLVQAKGGSTKKLFSHAENMGLSLPQTTSDLMHGKLQSVAIEGPYGFVRPLQQFDSVMLIAGSTGATFTMPLLRDLVHSWKVVVNESRSSRNRVVTRRAKYIWIVKSGKQLDWFAREFNQLMEDVQSLQSQGHDFDVEVSVYITCDDTFTTEQKSILEALHMSKSQPQPEHGSISELRASNDYEYLDEKKGASLAKEEVEIRELAAPSLYSDADPSKQSCGPDGTCCCTATIEDEDDDDAIRPACTCNCGAGPSSTASYSSNSFSEKPKTKQPLLHPSINIFSGRPACSNLIRKSLEQAHGESAVVVCGPAGLVNDVRASTVKLSDERAVHKGTGAQGIWLHTEAFGY